jgi:23S rRNA pseudouridine1911/1915/1917 synthase
MREFTIGPDQTGQRLDVFVAAQYPQFSRSSLIGLFKDGMITVNSKAVKAGYKIKPGDSVNVDQKLLTSEPEAIDLPVIYEDDSVVVIDKPAGILSHSKGALNTEATAASFIKVKITDDKLQGNRAGIVHRLDRHTSGVMITAKSEDALKHLQKQFSQRKTKKTYIAIVEGNLDPPEAVIDASVLRNPRKPQTFIVSAAGKPAVTGYKRLKTFERGGQTYSLVQLKPQTGRTHQLRVHMAYIKHPIVGDIVYGHGADQMMLHAGSLELTLPDSQRRTFSSETPTRIKEFAGL